MWIRLPKRGILHLHLGEGNCTTAQRKVSLVRAHLEYATAVWDP